MGIRREVVVVPHAPELGERDEAHEGETRRGCSQPIRNLPEQAIEERGNQHRNDRVGNQDRPQALTKNVEDRGVPVGCQGAV